MVRRGRDREFARGVLIWLGKLEGFVALPLDNAVERSERIIDDHGGPDTRRALDDL